jgi:hypothetical protein
MRPRTVMPAFLPPQIPPHFRNRAFAARRRYPDTAKLDGPSRHQVHYGLPEGCAIQRRTCQGQCRSAGPVRCVTKLGRMQANLSRAVLTISRHTEIRDSRSRLTEIVDCSKQSRWPLGTGVESSSVEVHKYEPDSAIGEGNPRVTCAGRGKIVPSHTPACL